MATFLIASILFGLVFLASLISIRFGLAAAIIEITFGVLAGNFLGVPTHVSWIAFLASFGGMYLTFQAGTEVDTRLFKKHWLESALIGGMSFLVPFIGEFLLAYYGFHWSFGASKIAALALSTTSLAVVYAVVVETGLSQTRYGKRLMAATFVEDASTAIFLTLLFLSFNWYTLFFGIASVIALFAFPKIVPLIVSRYGNKVVEPEIKFIFLTIFILLWLGNAGNNQPGLPIFFLGLLLSNFLLRNPEIRKKLRTIAFAMVTPFFFFQGGLNVNLKDVWAGIGILAIFVAVKLVTKFVGVWPFAAKYHEKNAMFTTLLMSTGLTFGTISSLYGLQHHIITTGQFSILITGVIISAVLPTIIALKGFPPQSETMKDLITAEGEEG
ncbi:MAG TPA: cation:proton antiporter [Candidatus Dormibacteraeota bacterium]|nr:cation:proton antiporter [Candidatus Dormibacteraeota bacterium]